MRIKIIAYFLSILFHAVIVLALYTFTNKPALETTGEINFQVVLSPPQPVENSPAPQPEIPPPNTPESTPRPQPEEKAEAAEEQDKIVPQPESKIVIPPILRARDIDYDSLRFDPFIEENDIDIDDVNRFIGLDKLPERLDFWAFSDIEIDYSLLSKEDSLRILQVKLDSVMSQFEFHDLNQPYTRDAASEEYYSRYSNPTVPILPALFAGAKLLKDLLGKRFGSKHEEKDLDLEINEIYAMKVIWKNKGNTPSTVYGKMPAVSGVTVITIKHILENLADKGVLVKSKGSPKGELEDSFFATVTQRDVLDFFDAKKATFEWAIDDTGGMLDFDEDLEIVNRKIELLKDIR